MKQLTITFKSFLFLLLVICILASSVNTVIAGTLTYELDYMFSGTVGQDEPASTTMPWLTATFEDFGTGTVTLKMEANNLTGNESVAAWYFNFDPTLNLNDLSFNYISGGVAEKDIDIYTGNDGYQANGDGLYDIFIDLPPPPGNQAKRFNAGETVVYNITSSTDTLAVSAFDFFSTPRGGQGVYNTAAFVQQTGPGGNNSAWIAPTTVVPEPISSTLFIIGGAALGFRRFRKTNKV